MESMFFYLYPGTISETLKANTVYHILTRWAMFLLIQDQNIFPGVVSQPWTIANVLSTI